MPRVGYRLKSARRQAQEALQRGQSELFEPVLPAQRVEQVIQERVKNWKNRLFSPATTLWSFVRQVMDPDGSCAQALSHLKALLGCKGEKCSSNTSGYCQARARLPLEVPQSLALEVGQRLHEGVAQKHLWCGRRVKVADGTGVSMPDTALNQALYPQSSQQKPGCGFPGAHLVMVFCLLSGALLALSCGALNTSEAVLFHQLWDSLLPGEVLLGDSRYSSYAEIAWLRLRQVDVVSRLNPWRKLDWELAKKLGKDDALFVWKRGVRPKWLDPEPFAALPKEMRVRVLRLHVAVPGFRPRLIKLCTTLLDPKLYPASELARLFRLRWHAELNLDHIKTTLGLDVLRCKSPQMVLKELWVHLLAYNLLRSLMSRAAAASDLDPLRLSFKRTLQLYLSYSALMSLVPASILPLLSSSLLQEVAAALLLYRPDRVEPRCVKRRHKDFPYLTRPRHKPAQVPPI